VVPEQKTFPYQSWLRVPFVFVPKGSPPPLEWMAAYPNYVMIPAVFIPRPSAEADRALEPRPEAEGQADPPPEEPTFLVEIDYAGNFIARPVAPLTLRPAPWTEPPPAPLTEEAPAPEPEVEPEPPPRPDYLRCVPPPEPRRARGGPPPLGPNPAARGIDPLAPEFTRNLVRKTARIMAGMDRVIRPGGIATDEGFSAAVRAGMQHLAAHKGGVRAALAPLKAAGTAGQRSERTPSHSRGRKSSGQTTEDDAALFERLGTRYTVTLRNDLRLASWAPPAPPAAIPDGPWEPQPGQPPGNYMGPKRAKGPRAQCKIVPDENHGGPAGTKAPYWKLYIPGQRVKKYSLDGRPLPPGNEGHPQDDLRKVTPAPPSAEPGVSTSPTPDTVPNPYLPPDLNPSLLNDPDL
jgi:hypothetical protein